MTKITRTRTAHRWTVMVAAMLLAIGLVAPSASANHLEPGTAGTPSGGGTQPTVVAGNPTCADLIPSTDYVFEFKLDPGADYDGPVSGGGLSGNLVVDTYTSDHGPLFDFTFTGGIGVSAVFSKGGDFGGNLYDYRPDGTDADTALHSPVNPSGTYAGLSHISFCIIDLAEPSTSLTMDTTGLDDPGLASYDPVTNTLTVMSGETVAIPVNELNDGNVTLTNAYVEFAGATCDEGQIQPPLPGTTLDPGDDLDATCTFVTSAAGSVTVSATGHGTYGGKDVTWDPTVCTTDGEVVGDILCDEDEYVEITVVTINPSTDLSLDVLASTTATQDPFDPNHYTIAIDYGGSVDLTFDELNDGDEALENVYIDVDHPDCGTDPGVATLAVDATHSFSCATLTNITATQTVTATGHGEDALGNDVTWCADPTDPPAGVTCDQDERVTVDIVVNFGEGCTPGLWRQYDQMLGKGPKARVHWIEAEWADSPYSYDDDAGTVFGVPAWDGITLGELTKLGGGGEAALGRHAAAALQNILHPDIDYFGYTSDQAGVDALIADVQAAFAAGDAEIEALHTMLADWNDQGDCELSNS